MPIPDGLERKDILRAMEDLRPYLNDIKNGPHDSTGYDVLSDGDGLRFPPKAVISRAVGIKFGTDLPFEEFSGGNSSGYANDVLRKLGFNVVQKTVTDRVTEPVFGELPGFPPGSQFENRRQVSEAYLHRPEMAGIWGTGTTGAYSIVLSGGYVDDMDYGDEIIYTGQGGRDPDSGRQIANQTLTKGNRALAKSHAEGLPVRVIRGAQHRSEFSPKTGYRYDGVYRVADYWKERGADGFDVWRYKLLQIDSSADASDGEITFPKGEHEPGRRTTVSLRVVRDSKVCKAVKELYGHKCQICGLKIETPGGPYSEGAHIRPLGRPHNGSDTIDNILCLCPNHHVMFDNFGFTLTDDLRLIGIASTFNVHDKHEISLENIRYHRAHRYKNPLDK